MAMYMRWTASSTTAAAWVLVRLKANGLAASKGRRSWRVLPLDIRPEEYYPGRFETKQAFRRIDHALRELETNRDLVELALNGYDIERIRAKGKIAAILDIEGSYDLDGDLGVLRDLYRLGLRSAQLSAHNWDQNYADSCCSPPKSNGLSAHGRDVIHEMNRLGMVINVSHSSDESILQAIDVSDAPVVATHHGLRSVNNIPRLMPDDLLKKLAAKGGVFGFQIGSEFNYPKEYAWLTAQRGKTFFDTTSIPDKVKGKTIYELDQMMAKQFPMLGAHVPDSVAMAVDDWVAVVDKAIQLVGEDHVSIGTDFDGGPYSCTRHARCPRPSHDHRCHASSRLL